MVAHRIGQSTLRIEDLEVPIAEAIIEGNAVHSWILKNKIVSHPYLNAEEALKFGGKKLNHLKEWVQAELIQTIGLKQFVFSEIWSNCRKYRDFLGEIHQKIS